METTEPIQAEQDSMQRFGGIARLYSTQALDRLSKSHVCVIGIGGVGSWTVESLARTGVGHLTLVDMDDVCITNINRQIHATTRTVGQLKVEAMKQRVLEIHPQCHVRPIPQFFTAANADEILGKDFDCVVDAIDSLKNKCLLLDACVKRGLKVVTTGGAGGKKSPFGIRCEDLSRATHDRLLAKVRKHARSHYPFPKDSKTAWGISSVFSPEPQIPPQDCNPSDSNGSSLRLNCATGYGTASFVTGPLGMAAAAEAVRLILENEPRRTDSQIAG